MPLSKLCIAALKKLGGLANALEEVEKSTLPPAEKQKMEIMLEREIAQAGIAVGEQCHFGRPPL
jgi:hypothetical protein